MTLKRQLIISFVMVAVLPLVVAALYLFWTNISLSFELYEENLVNSTKIQADIMTEQVNRFKVRTNRFASSRQVVEYFLIPETQRPDMLKYKDMSDEIIRFTDETLDSIYVFSLMDLNGNVCYSSGSNTDINRLNDLSRELLDIKKQTVVELTWTGNNDSLIIVTPIIGGKNSSIVGFFVAAYNNDYFMKTVGNRGRLDESSSFIYCKEHREPVEEKWKSYGLLDEFSEKIEFDSDGKIICEMYGKESMVSYQGIANTPWMFVSFIPSNRAYSQIFDYVMLNILVFILSLLSVFLLSRVQSRRILQPLSNLLNDVEKFFTSGNIRTDMEIDKKTEIGYLAEKFVGMAGDMSLVQAKLRESNYLYEAILKATYDLRITIDFELDEVNSSLKDVNEFFESLENMSPSDKAIYFFVRLGSNYSNQMVNTLRNIAYGQINEPVEAEACCTMLHGGCDTWFRIIAVPIISENGEEKILKVVMHLEDITAKKLEELKLMESAQCDPLTNLLNKKAFSNLAKVYDSEKGMCRAMFFIDLDNFKKVNDNLGHAEGDRLLIEVANKLTAQFRTTDLVARYGGDEFVAFVPGMPRMLAERKASSLLQNIPSEYPVPGGEPIHVTASIGIAISDELSFDSMLLGADEAMYVAKQRGKCQYYVWQDKGDKNI